MSVSWEYLELAASPPTNGHSICRDALPWAARIEPDVRTARLVARSLMRPSVMRSIYSRTDEVDSSAVRRQRAARALWNFLSLRRERAGLSTALASWPWSDFRRHGLCRQHGVGEFHGGTRNRQCNRRETCGSRT